MRLASFGLVLGLLPAPFVAGQEADPDLEKFRTEFVRFLTDLREVAPNAFGAASADAKAAEQLAARVRQLTPDQLRRVKAIFDKTGAWQDVPEALGTLRQGLAAASPAEADGQLRTNVGGVLALLQLAPDETLHELKLDRARVTQAQQQVSRMTPQQLFAARAGAPRAASWEEVAAALEGALAPELQRSVVELVRSGGLTTEQRRELEAFRKRLGAFYALAQLQPSAPGAPADDSDTRLAELHEMTAEMLYLVRARMAEEPALQERLQHGLTDEQQAALKTLEEIGPLTDDDKQGLATFRGDLIAFRSSVFAAAPQLSSSVAWQAVDRFTPQQLAVVQHRFDGTLPGWRSLDAYNTIVRSGEVFAAARATGPADSTRIEAIRSEILAAAGRAPAGAVGSSAGSALARLPAPGVAVFGEILDRAPAGQRADMARLLASFAAQGGDGLQTGGPLRPGLVPAVNRPNLGSCFSFRDIGSIINGFVDTLIPDSSLPWGVSIPTGIDFNCIGNQFTDIVNELNNVVNEVAGLANDIIDPIKNFINTNVVAPLNQVKSVFETFGRNVIDFLQSFNPLTFLSTAASGFSSLVNTIDQGAGQAVQALRIFLAALRQPLLTEIERAKGNNSVFLTELDKLFFHVTPNPTPFDPLGIVPAFIGALCAPGQFDPATGACRRGLTIPLLGPIGSDESVSRCKIITTEVDFLENLMPEEGWDGLKLADIAVNAFVHKVNELCAINEYVADGRGALEDAEAEQATQLFRTTVINNQELIKQTLLVTNTSLSAQLAQVQANVTNAIGASEGRVRGALAATEVNIRSDVRDSEGRLTLRVDVAETRLGQTLDEIRQLISDLNMQAQDKILKAIEDAENAIKDAIGEFRELETRLDVEGALIQDGKAQVATFQLPESVGGLLETVREVVSKTIDMKIQVGEDVTKALRELAKGDADRLNGDYRGAYEQYRKAYQALAK